MNGNVEAGREGEAEQIHILVYRSNVTLPMWTKICTVKQLDLRIKPVTMYFSKFTPQFKSDIKNNDFNGLVRKNRFITGVFVLNPFIVRGVMAV